ncbi:hypothetical protein [Halobacterium sp. KA-6]|uniref:hypothetical protein n=1 Tax=Halobacterium sp. KA-6 TaxID=2896368 RepID=UPI001E4172F6|nr:hypothetical protein [Halobacterium sp. KA-6]MCD2204895.1 hypothetical protein [Halobacterium sp. KA-6]
MTTVPDAGLTLTGPHDTLDSALDACHSEIAEIAPPLLDACTEQTDDLLADLFEDREGTPGAGLTDEEDRTALREYIATQLSESWFPELNGRGSELGLNWTAFKTAVQRYTECLYLRAFDAYGIATEAFTTIERCRTKAERLFDDIETRLQRDQPDTMTESEDPLQSLFEDAAECVTDAKHRLADAKTAVRRVHAYYAIGEAYQTEFEFEPTDFSYVALTDDPDWFLQDLRHQRDRLDTRVDWLQTDFTNLQQR